MKNRVFRAAISAASISFFFFLAAFATVCNVSAHPDYNETFGEIGGISFTGYHRHDATGVLHRHAVLPPTDVTAPHDKLDLWREHEHQTPTRQSGLYLLKIHCSHSLPTDLPDGSVGLYVVTYARSSDADFVDEIITTLFAEEINLDGELLYNSERATANFQYYGQHIEGLSPSEETDTARNAPTKPKHLTLRWAELKAR